MPRLRRLVLVRHGESTGRSSTHLVGSGDPDLAAEGREQVRASAVGYAHLPFDLVVASPLRRAWQSARLLVGDAPIRIEADFREVDFGRWEGRAVSEVRASDPVLYEQWQQGAPGFEYPGGERRGEFRARIQRGLQRLLDGPAHSPLVVAHKGVVRVIAETLAGEGLLERERPRLGEAVILTRVGDTWSPGVRASS